jgi:hypothetical protein
MLKGFFENPFFCVPMLLVGSFMVLCVILSTSESVGDWKLKRNKK